MEDGWILTKSLQCFHNDLSDALLQWLLARALNRQRADEDHSHNLCAHCSPNVGLTELKHFTIDRIA